MCNGIYFLKFLKRALGNKLYLVDVPDILYFFLFRGRGKGGSPRRKGIFSFKNREGGKVSEEGRQGFAHLGWESVAGRGGG